MSGQDQAVAAKVTLESVSWTLNATEEDIPVRGNALASGDDAEDKRAEDAILVSLENGDVWAWCTVEVRGTWHGITESEYLGCCSYADEAQFVQPGGYYDDMRAAVLERIRARVSAIADEVSEAKGVQS